MQQSSIADDFDYSVILEDKVKSNADFSTFNKAGGGQEDALFQPSIYNKFFSSKSTNVLLGKPSTNETEQDNLEKSNLLEANNDSIESTSP